MNLYNAISLNLTSTVNCKCFWQVNYPIPSNLNFSQLSTCLNLIEETNPYRTSLCDNFDQAVQYRMETTTFDLGFMTPDPEEFVAQFQILFKKVCTDVLFQLTRESYVYSNTLSGTNQTDYTMFVMTKFWDVLKESAHNSSRTMGDTDGICWLKDYLASSLIPYNFASDYDRVGDNVPNPLVVIDSTTNRPKHYSNGELFTYYEDYLSQCQPYFCSYFLQADTKDALLTTMGILGTLFSLTMFLGVVGYKIVKLCVKAEQKLEKQLTNRDSYKLTKTNVTETNSNRESVIELKELNASPLSGRRELMDGSVQNALVTEMDASTQNGVVTE